MMGRQIDPLRDTVPVLFRSRSETAPAPDVPLWMKQANGWTWCFPAANQLMAVEAVRDLEGYVVGFKVKGDLS